MHERDKDSLSARFRRLPAVEPGVETRRAVLAAMAEAAQPQHSQGVTDRGGRAGGFAMPGLAAAAGIAAVSVLAGLLAITAGRIAPEPAASQLSFIPAVDATVEPLIEASWLLERAMSQLPEPRRVMRVGTASTIAVLEGRIAFIDGQLEDAHANAADTAVTAALWRERVDAMTALYDVRYGQSRQFSF
jgi:hypothetical protein